MRKGRRREKWRHPSGNFNWAIHASIVTACIEIDWMDKLSNWSVCIQWNSNYMMLLFYFPIFLMHSVLLSVFHLYSHFGRSLHVLYQVGYHLFGTTFDFACCYLNSFGGNLTTHFSATEADSMLSLSIWSFELVYDAIGICIPITYHLSSTRLGSVQRGFLLWI